jgi:hypothetical protein
MKNTQKKQKKENRRLLHPSESRNLSLVRQVKYKMTAPEVLTVREKYSQFHSANLFIEIIAIISIAKFSCRSH